MIIGAQLSRSENHGTEDIGLHTLIEACQPEGAIDSLSVPGQTLGLAFPGLHPNLQQICRIPHY